MIKDVIIHRFVGECRRFPEADLNQAARRRTLRARFRNSLLNINQASCTEQQAAHVLGRQVRYSIVSICFLRRESTMKSNSSYSFQIGAA